VAPARAQTLRALPADPHPAAEEGKGNVALEFHGAGMLADYPETTTTPLHPIQATE